jgi:hypothetical protein
VQDDLDVGHNYATGVCALEVDAIKEKAIVKDAISRKRNR